MRYRHHVFAIVFSLLWVQPCFAQSKQTPEFQLWRFDETQHGCGAKGRLQDKTYCSSKIVDDVIARGKASLPMLISELSDTRTTKTPVFDFWSYTAAGDVAFALLNDLFTGDDWKTFNMTGAPGWDAVREHCSAASEQCWRQYLRKHGRRYVQQKWMSAWHDNKDRIRWDAKARCFRLS